MDQNLDYLKQNQAKEWINNILGFAIDNRASDIHFEPEQDLYRVRFRVDGLLTDAPELMGYLKEPATSVLSRIKVLAKMDITGHYVPQDGHFEYMRQETIYNIRVSTFPTTNGETIVLRIHNRNDILMRLENLGFDQPQLNTIMRVISNPSGLVLITGPSGSGKTTLLYSILNTLHKSQNNIITLEDPVELEMLNTRQVQINEALGMSFPTAMRAVIRQDPDIVMLGEIRDSETAQMAFQAALIGILILSTFHTLDTPGLVMRFIEMGIPHSVVAYALSGVISSRLLRKICPNCKIEVKKTDLDNTFLGEKAATANLFQGKGCDMCKKTGYRGRTGIFEIVPFDEEIRTAIVEKITASEFLNMLRKKQIRHLQDMAIDKALQGTTTIEEVIRVTGMPSHVSK